MSLMTSPAAIGVRYVLRKMGVTRAYMSLARGSGYEVLLTGAMRRAVHAGDTVWDVGANIGDYAVQFADWVGPEGHVYAFEPSRETGARLAASCASRTNVAILPLGLSDRTGEAKLLRGADVDGATARVADDAGGDAEDGAFDPVALARGDDLIASGLAAVPSLVKLDVEGHELDVLHGMANTLADRRLSHLFIEVHFAVLHRTGRKDVPAKLERFLEMKGFRIAWVDQSHLHARRLAA
ncbi:MAG: FkbM family methyltransferase [Alphaproteobacteria bacterium]|nr:FkbM family methyltransferase [Alphaproteobacteria bacterium]